MNNKRLMKVIGLLAVVALLAAALPLEAKAQTVNEVVYTVCSEGCDHTTIQDAVLAVRSLTDPGTLTTYRIAVGAGVYDTASTIDIVQQNNKNIILDGASKDSVTIKDQIRIDGNSRHAAVETVTIQDFTFDFSDLSGDIITTSKIVSPTYVYAHNITVKDCKFLGNEDLEKYGKVVAVRAAAAGGHTNFVLENLEGVHIHSLLQATSVTQPGVTVKNSTVTDSLSGLNLSNTPGFVDGFTFNGSETGIRTDYPLTVTNSSIISAGDTSDLSDPKTAIVTRFANNKTITIENSVIKNTVEGNYAIANATSSPASSVTLVIKNVDTGGGSFDLSLVGGLGPVILGHTTDQTTTYTSFATIQSAIDAALPGDTINVAAGTYTENIDINKAGLSLIGAGVDATKITGRIFITNINVKVSDLTVNGGASWSEAPETAGIAIKGGTSGHELSRLKVSRSAPVTGRGLQFGYNVSNVEVNDLEVSGWVSGVYINPSSGITFDGLFAHNNTVGIGSDGISNVTIANSRFENNTAEGFGVSNVGTGVSITNSQFIGNGAGIVIYPPSSPVVVKYCSFEENGKAVDNKSTSPLLAENNWWGSPEGPEPGSISGSGVDYQPWLILSDVVLSESDIDENLPKDTVIGTFSPVDAEPTDVFTYALVDTTHYPDNANFKIVGDQLLSNAIFDYEEDDSYVIRVSATDPWGTVFEKPFTITINDVNEDPVLDQIDYEDEVDEGTTLTFSAVAEDEEVEVGAQTITFSLVGAPTGASITTVGAFSWTIAEEQGPGVYTFTVKVCDNGEPVLCDEETITVTVNEVNANPVAVADFYGVIKNTPRVVAAPGVLANDTDADLPATTLTAVMQDDPDKGTLVLNSDGSFTYTPDTDELGTDSFTYKVFDGKHYSNVQTVTLTIQATSNKPSAIALSSATIPENAGSGTVIGTLTTTDADSGDHFTYTLVPGEGDADNASFKIVGDKLQSAEVFNHEVKSSYSIRIRSTDQFGGDNYVEKVFEITVSDVPEAPVLTPIGDKVVDEKTLLTFTATATDEDVPVQPLTFSLTSADPANYGAQINVPTSGVFRWTPIEAQGFGVYTFTITVCDAATGGLCDSETFKVTVNEVNSAPVANDQSVTLAEDKAEGVAITLTGSDADHDPADTLTYSIVSQPAHGTLSPLSADDQGVLRITTYRPTLNYNGPDSFTFKIYDGREYSNIATVSISVTPVNDAPDSDDESYNVLKGQTLTVDAPGVLLNDTDVEEDTLTAVLTMNVSRGTLTLNPDGSFTYIPGAGDYISDTFKYKAFDGTAYSPEAVVTLTIINSNTPPANLDLTPKNGPENEKYEGTLSANDTTGDVLSYSLVSGSGSFDNDAFEIEGTELKSKSEFNFEEKDAYYVRIRVTDQFGGFSEAPFIITVTDVNDAPVANDQDVSTLMNTPIEITLTGSDEDGDDLTYAIFSEPEHGTLDAPELTGINFAGEGVLRVVENKLTYTPDEGFAGEDSFTFKVMDEEGLISNLATVTIQVSDLPIAVDDAYEATEDEELSVDAEEGVLANDTIHDETVELIAALVDDVEHGTLELAADGSFTYLPEENFVGEDVFTYNACIEGGECSEEPATVTITVEPVNDEPNAVDDEYETPMGKKLEVPAPGVLENDIDPDQGDEQTVEVKDAPLHGVLVLNPDGSFTYEPAAGFHGIDTFTYWLTSEPGVQSAYLDWATVTITVRPQFTIFLPILVK